MELNELVTQLGTLAGFGGLIALIVNALKTFGVVKNGQSPIWSLGLNVAGIVILFLLKVFKPDVDPAQYDGIAGKIVTIATLALGLFVQLGGSKGVHNLVRGVPLLGKSFS